MAVGAGKTFIKEKSFMAKSFGFSAVACLVAAAAFSPVSFAVDVPEVSGPAVSVAPGEVRKTRRLRDGVEVSQSARLIDDNTLEATRDDGCAWTRSIEDRYGPSLTWTNCSKSPWGTGKAIDIKKDGQLWPFKVGNKVKYKYKAVNSKGKTNRNAFRNCEVEDTALVTAGGKEYPSYKVKCYDHTGDRTMYYAPAAETTVYMERNRKRGPKQTMEYLGEM